MPGSEVKQSSVVEVLFDSDRGKVKTLGVVKSVTDQTVHVILDERRNVVRSVPVGAVRSTGFAAPSAAAKLPVLGGDSKDSAKRVAATNAPPTAATQDHEANPLSAVDAVWLATVGSLAANETWMAAPRTFMFVVLVCVVVLFSLMADRASFSPCNDPIMYVVSGLQQYSTALPLIRAVAGCLLISQCVSVENISMAGIGLWLTVLVLVTAVSSWNVQNGFDPLPVTAHDAVMAALAAVALFRLWK